MMLIQFTRRYISYLAVAIVILTGIPLVTWCPMSLLIAQPLKARQERNKGLRIPRTFGVPVVRDGIVILTGIEHETPEAGQSKGYRLLGVNAKTGERIWEKHDKHLVIVHDQPGQPPILERMRKLYKVDPATGEEIFLCELRDWQKSKTYLPDCDVEQRILKLIKRSDREAQAALISEPHITTGLQEVLYVDEELIVAWLFDRVVEGPDEDEVFVENHHALAFDRKTLEIKWVFPFKDTYAIQVAAVGSNIVIHTSRVIYCLDKVTGSLQSFQEATREDRGFGGVAAYGKDILYVKNNIQLHRATLPDLKSEQIANLKRAYPLGIEVYKDFIITPRTKFHTIHTIDGELLWLKGYIKRGRVTAGKLYYTENIKGTVYLGVFDLETRSERRIYSEIVPG